MVTKTQAFIQRAIAIHGNKYRYDKVKYIDNRTKVIVICPKHGEFQITPEKHLKQECEKCRNEYFDQMIAKYKTRENAIKYVFQEDLRKKYPFIEILNLDEYKSRKGKIHVKCLKHENIYSDSPNNLLKHITCPDCKEEMIEENLKKNYKRIKDSKIRIMTYFGIDENKFDTIFEIFFNEDDQLVIVYKGITFVRVKDNRFFPSKIVGWDKNKFRNMKEVIFWLYNDSFFDKILMDTLCKNNLKQYEIVDVWKMRAKKVHNNKYLYSKVKFNSYKQTIKIICPKHGVFECKPLQHLSNQNGCPKCNNSPSSIEMKVYNQLKEVYEGSIIQNYRMDGREFDIYLPSKNLVIELNGNYYHSEMYYYCDKHKDRKLEWFKHHMLDKINFCKSEGLNTLFFYEDEINNNNKFKSIIQTILNNTQSSQIKYFARDLQFKSIPMEEAKRFYSLYSLKFEMTELEKYSHYAFKNEYNEAIAIFSLIQIDENEVEIKNHCYHYPVLNSVERLKGEIRKIWPKIKCITVECDNRLNEGCIFERNGFRFYKSIKAAYSYIQRNNVTRLHKSNFFKSRQKEIWPNYQEGLSEADNARNNNYFRIWDAGRTLLKYTYK